MTNIYIFLHYVTEKRKVLCTGVCKTGWKIIQVDRDFTTERLVLAIQITLLSKILSLLNFRYKKYQNCGIQPLKSALISILGTNMHT